MYGESSRPVYTKSRSTKKRDRFHGAFRGGFSAGHFNTVASSKGWRPHDYDDEEDQDPHDVRKGNKDNNKKKNKPSTSKILLDYMDEEDANDWGGPSSLKQTFQTNHDSSFQVRDDVSNIQQFLNHKLKSNETESIGKRLLRVLGWREQKEGHIVYLPLEEEWLPSDPSKEPSHKYFANKKLKRIVFKVNEQMQKSIPPPKTDVHGIGFDPFVNAPEFQHHRDMRKKRAQLRALAATSQGGEHRKNVYRTSDLKSLLHVKEDESNPENDFNKHKPLRDSNESETNVLAYETADDFIGTKTVSGFALHDDDDDVYDDDPFQEKDGNISKNAHFNLEEYNTEIYQDNDSDEETDDMKPNRGLKTSGIDTFEGAMSIWASDTKAKVSAVTNDGSHVLQGFVMGSESHSLTSRRWPGPDVPVGYVVERHKHSNPEDIGRIKALSHDIKSNMLSKRMQSKLHEDGGHVMKRSLTPMAGNHFFSLANTLKSRFTTSTNGEIQNTTSEKSKEDTKSKPSVSRSCVNWQPSHLLCKRFNVPVPRLMHVAGVPPSSTVESKEESFFKEHILSKIESLPPRENLDINSLHAPIESEIDFERPTMEYMKSIFDATFESDMSISDDDNETHHSEENTEKVASHQTAASSDTSKKMESKLSDYDRTSKDQLKHQKIETSDLLKENSSAHKISSKKRSRDKSDSHYHSYSSSDDSDESRRRKRKKKHRRKQDSKKSYKKKHHKR